MAGDPSQAAEVLKKKAMLLLRREQELHVLRTERARSETWLHLFHRLSLDLGTSDAIELMKKWAMMLIGQLGFQAAGVYRRDKASGDLVAQWAEPAARLGRCVRLDEEAGEILRTRSCGRHDPADESSPGVRSLAEQLGLAKFYWLDYAAHGDELLMVEGFSREASSFHSLSDSDCGHFEMFSQHLGAMLENVALLARLGDERVELRRSNLELDENLQVLRLTQRQLVRVSRAAGMAEIASGVLHDVGNTLTSVNVSAELIGEKLGDLDTDRLSAAVDLLERHRDDMARFLDTDARGSKLVSYLRMIADALGGRHEELVEEVRLLRDHVHQMKELINKHREHARPMLAIERCEVPELVGEAVAVVASTFAEHGIELVLEHGELPPVSVDRHRVVQILLNLLTGARHAVVEGRPEHGRVVVRTRRGGDARFSIELADNGVGIASEDLDLVFAPGVTSCMKRRGPGLHDAILSARSMDGQLSCASQGQGHGAVFTLELPLHPRPRD